VVKYLRMNEVEVKIRLSKPGAILRKLREEGFRMQTRELERDIVLDQPDQPLRATGRLLRLRRHGRNWKLTYKGPAEDDQRYKSREEIETAVINGPNLQQILERLGFAVVFSYEKRRRTFQRRHRRGDGHGHVLLDETPIGWYLELEGSRRWIDATAQRLGFSSKDYVTKSYGLLYREYCEARGIKPTHMLFRRIRR